MGAYNLRWEHKGSTLYSLHEIGATIAKHLFGDLSNNFLNFCSFKCEANILLEVPAFPEVCRFQFLQCMLFTIVFVGLLMNSLVNYKLFLLQHFFVAVSSLEGMS